MFCGNTFEQVWVQLKVTTEHFTVGGVCTPRSAVNLSFLEETLAALYRDVYIGNLNINMLNTNTAQFSHMTYIL